MSKRNLIRRVGTFIHRWNGLLIAVFLVIVGLTGSLLALRVPIDRALNPELYATPRPGQLPLSLSELAEIAEASDPNIRVGYFAVDHDQAMMMVGGAPDPSAPGGYKKLTYDHILLDPYTGRVLGRKGPGIGPWRWHVTDFIYDLHTSLATRSNFGGQIVGIVALLWTIDCFIAFYLTLPVGAGNWWRRWREAWGVKWSASSFRLNFDLHRSIGLWLWPILFCFGWSSVMLGLTPVYEKVMGAVFDYRGIDASIDHYILPKPIDNPKIHWHDAELLGQRYMDDAAKLYNFKIERPYGMAYIDSFGFYTYGVRSSMDIRGHGWDTTLWLDGNTGKLVEVQLPHGQHLGNSIGTFLWGMHYGDLRDNPVYRGFVVLLGLLIAILSYTGVYIWWRKLQVRRANRRTQKMRTATTSV